MTRTIRIGTRGSALALAQARQVAAALDAAGVPHAVVTIETDGDRRAADTPWGEGAFVAAIETALLDGRVDVAVHSAKDMPTDEDERLRIAAFLPRADPRDVLVIRGDVTGTDLGSLPAGSRVGTDSPRRAGFVLAIRPDLAIVPIHGNVDTRLRRLDAGEAEALVLAAAGLERLGRTDRITQRLAPEACPPAPGQGAIAVQVRADDDDAGALVAAVDDERTRIAVELERAFLRAMGGGCRSPVGALAVIDGEALTLLGGAAGVDGADAHIGRVEGSLRAPGELVARLVERLRPPVTASPGAGRRRRVLITRAADGIDRLAPALARLGIDAVAVPAIATRPEAPGGPLDRALLDPSGWHWIVVTSPTGAGAVLEAMARLGQDPATRGWAAVGPTSAAVLAAGGVQEVWMPVVTRSEGVAAELPLERGARVLLARGDLAGDRLPVGLRDRGATVHEVLAYRTLEAPAGSTALLAAALDGDPPDAVLFASGSAVRGTLALAGDRGPAVRALPAICLGPETAAEARRLGFHVVGEAPMQSADALATLTASLLATRSAPGVPR